MIENTILEMTPAEKSEKCSEIIGDFNAKNSADHINHPPHYNTGKIEVIEFIEDQRLGFNLGNAVKYIARAGKKDPCKTVEDLEKAIWYCRREIAIERNREDAIPIPRPNDMPMERTCLS